MVRVTKLELHRSISDIMKKGNLDKLTTKQIRILCEQKYKVDLTSRKEEIDKIVMAFVRKKSGTSEKADKVSNESSNDEASSYESDECGSSCSSKSGSARCYSADIQECSYSESSEEEPTPKKENIGGPSSRSGSPRCHSADIQDSSYSESSDEEPIPKNKVNKVKTIRPASPKKVVKASTRPLSKKGKVYTSNSQAKKGKVDSSKQAELDDAAYARKLQAEEWSFRQRTVRNLFRDTPKRKNENDDELTKKKKAGAFMKKCMLSPALAELIGTNQMSRPDIVQKMWAIVRERNLFDESNKQYALLDEQLMKVFGKKRVRLIGMMKHLKNHIKDIR